MTGPDPENDRDPKGDMKEPDVDEGDAWEDPEGDLEGDPGADPDEPGDQSPISEPE